MVCYCPLSVLSVPESILNEGQLHLAAIFQLSRHHHGDPVVFFDEPGCKQRGACMRGEQRTESSSGGRGGSPSLPCRQHPASTARAPLICRGVGDQHLHGAVTFTGAGDCSFILLLFSLPYTLLAVMTAILCSLTALQQHLRGCWKPQQTKPLREHVAGRGTSASLKYLPGTEAQ